jgi:hypothetical protein
MDRQGNPLAPPDVGYRENSWAAQHVGVAMNESGRHTRLKGDGLRDRLGRNRRGTDRLGRFARRSWYLVVGASAMALVPASAAAAATPVVAAKKHSDRNVGHVIIGLVVVLVILVALYLLVRVVRGRLRG